ncbi:hypothetical protein XANCAGTX0491_008619 [Xanthoria calcicola]
MILPLPQLPPRSFIYQVRYNSNLYYSLRGFHYPSLTSFSIEISTPQTSTNSSSNLFLLGLRPPTRHLSSTPNPIPLEPPLSYSGFSKASSAYTSAELFILELRLFAIEPTASNSSLTRSLPNSSSTNSSTSSLFFLKILPPRSFIEVFVIEFFLIEFFLIEFFVIEFFLIEFFVIEFFLIEFFLIEFFLIEFFLIEFFLIEFFLIEFFLIEFFLIEFFLIEFFLIEFFLIEFLLIEFLIIEISSCVIESTSLIPTSSNSSLSKPSSNSCPPYSNAPT